MNGPQTLSQRFEQVRRYTIALLERASDQDLRWAPSGLKNHILWRSGHAAWAIDLIIVQELTGRSELPTGWDNLFCEGADPSAYDGPWPPKHEMIEVLQAQQSRLLDLLSGLDPAALDQPAAYLSERMNLGGWILHALHDEALHQGETYLTLKMRHPTPKTDS